jgi:hypothetical protein
MQIIATQFCLNIPQFILHSFPKLKVNPLRPDGNSHRLLQLKIKQRSRRYNHGLPLPDPGGYSPNCGSFARAFPAVSDGSDRRPRRRSTRRFPHRLRTSLRIGSSHNRDEGAPYRQLSQP